MDVNGIWYGNYPLVSSPLVSLVVGKEMNSTFPKGHPKSCGTSWNIFFFSPTAGWSRSTGHRSVRHKEWGTNQCDGRKQLDQDLWNQESRTGSEMGGENDQPVEEWGTLRHPKWWTTGTTCTFGDIWKCGAWFAQVFCVSCV